MTDIRPGRVVRETGGAKGAPVPWWAKIAAKLVLSRLPVGYSIWSRLGLFRHGAPDAARMVRSFEEAFAAWRGDGERPFGSFLELGPGDSLGHALSAKARGAQSIYMVDVGDFATHDERHYRAIARELAALALPAPAADAPLDRSGVLAVTGARYLCEGVRSLQGIPDACIDIVYSTAALEHVNRDEFEPVLRELYRVLKPGGIGYHGVDLRDHLGGGLANLRIPSRLWEQPWFARSGFYTNRLRYREIIAMSRRVGFRVQVPMATVWKRLPVRRRQLAAEFRGHGEDDLAISTFLLIHRRS